jgi:hypothetical protein
MRGAATLLAALAALIVVIAAAVPAVLLARILRHSEAHRVVRAPRACISDIYPHLRTGDVLLFASASHLPSNSAFTGTFHSHAGMLLRAGGQVYSTESQAGTELMPAPGGREYHMPSGAAGVPLLPRLKYYTGAVYVMRLAPPLTPAQEARVLAAAHAAHCAAHPYPTPAQLAAACLGFRPAARHCFQHVAHLLDAAGLTHPESGGAFAERGLLRVCRDICALSGRPLPGGRAYGPPIELVYDLDTLRF